MKKQYQDYMEWALSQCADEVAKRLSKEEKTVLAAEAKKAKKLAEEEKKQKFLFPADGQIRMDFERKDV